MMNKSFPFNDEPDTACFVCKHVANKERPILHITHDDDGYWQFLCGDTHTESQAVIVSMHFAYQLDNTIGQVAHIDYGQTADRKSVSDEWIIK